MPASHVSDSRSTLDVFAAPCVEYELYTSTSFLLLLGPPSTPFCSFLLVELCYGVMDMTLTLIVASDKSMLSSQMVQTVQTKRDKRIGGEE